MEQIVTAIPAIVEAYRASAEPGRFTLHRSRITDAAALDLAVLPPMTAKRTRFYDAAQATLFEFRFDQHSISSILVDLNRMEVHKQLGRFAEHGLRDREIGWLRKLAPLGLAPTLRESRGNKLVLEYVGEPVRRYNLPADWRDQAEGILAGLKDAGCHHNDIKCDNLMVHEGRLMLVDYGWATPLGAPIPAEWPQGIGRQHRLGIHRFDDRHAMLAALQSAERDEVDRSIVMQVPQASPAL